MANDSYSVQLGRTPENPVGAPVYNPGPSPLSPILSTVSSGMQQYERDMDERRRRRREEADDAAERQETQAAREFVFATMDLNSGGQGLPNFSASLSTPTTVQPSQTPVQQAVASGEVTQADVESISNEVDGELDEIRNVETAVEQGRLPPTAREASIDRTLQAFMVRYPNLHPDVFLEIMGDLGIRNQISDNIRREQALIERGQAREDAIFENQTAIYTDMYRVGLEYLGPEAATSMSDDEIMREGLAVTHTQRQLETLRQRLEIQQAQGNLSEAQERRANEQMDREVTQIYTQQALASLAPIFNEMASITDMMGGDNIGTNPALEQQFAELHDLAVSRSEAIMTRMYNQVLTETGRPETAEAFRNILQQNIQTMLLDPLERRDTGFTRLANTLTTRLEMNVDQAFPLIAMLEATGFNLQLTDTLLNQMDPEMAQAIAQEVEGISNMNIYSVMGRRTAVQQMAGILEVLQGDASLADLRQTPEQAARSFGTINRTLLGMADDIASGNTTLAPQYANGMAEIAVAGGQLSRGASIQAQNNAIRVLTGNGNGARILRENFDGTPDGEILITGTRAATANVMENLRGKTGQLYGVYNVVFNETTNRWGTVINDDALTSYYSNRSPGGGFTGASGMFPGSDRPVPEVPAEARQLAAALNAGMSFLTLSHDLDNSVPQDIPEDELRAWYGNGVPSRTYVDRLAAEQGNAENREATAARIMESMTALESNLRRNDYTIDIPTRPGYNGVPVNANGSATVPNLQGNEVTIPSARELRQRHADNANFQALEAGIEAAGLSDYANVIITQIAGVENRSLSNGADSGSSRGIMQINRGVWDATSTEMFGKRVADLTPQENIQLGLHIWQEAFDRADGNLADTLAIYHSGVDWDTAGPTRNDGNLTVHNYVSGILSAAGAF